MPFEMQVKVRGKDENGKETLVWKTVRSSPPAVFYRYETFEEANRMLWMGYRESFPETVRVVEVSADQEPLR